MQLGFCLEASPSTVGLPLSFDLSRRSPASNKLYYLVKIRWALEIVSKVVSSKRRSFVGFLPCKIFRKGCVEAGEVSACVLVGHAASCTAWYANQPGAAPPWLETLAFKWRKFTWGHSSFGRNWLCQGFSLLAVLLGETETAHPEVKHEDNRTGSHSQQNLSYSPCLTLCVPISWPFFISNLFVSLIPSPG